MDDGKLKQQPKQTQAPKAPATGGHVPPRQKWQTSQAKAPVPPASGGQVPSQGTLRMTFAALSSPAVAEVIKTSLRQVQGVEDVTIDLTTHTVSVKGRNLKGSEITGIVERVLKAPGQGTPSTPQTPPSQGAGF